MRYLISKLIFLFFISMMIACESMNKALYTADHDVITIDRSQATNLNCVYLYNTEKRESGWSNSFATANALRVLKDQVKLAGGNAVVIRDIYSSKEYRDGYQLDAAGIYIDVYKCPLDKFEE